MTEKLQTKQVVFITGAFVTHHCWDTWQAYFQDQGYDTIAPPWPYKNGTASELRARQPHDTDLAALTLSELIESYAQVVKALPEKPIIIGHSLGGLITQVLVNNDLAAAGVAIHSAPPLGVFPYEFSLLRASWKSLGLFTSLQKTYLMSFPDWQYAFVNTMPLEDQHTAYQQLAIPESKRVLRGGLTHEARVEFTRKHPPLLFTSGDLDTIIPAHLNKRTYEKYKSYNNGVVDYKEFNGRNHFVLGQDTWKEDAEYILDWLELR